MVRRLAAPVPIDGEVAPGFEPVRVEFERNFRERKELGAAFAVFHRGRKVVDLWGGHRDAARSRPWQRDTVTTVFSTTKGVASLTLAVAQSRGLFDWDAPVSACWPEFEQNGKRDVTVRQLVGHQAGLCAIDTPLDAALLGDLDRLADVLARQAPAWTPGAAHGYHAISLGWYQGELLRRVDPQHRNLGRFFAEEIAAPLGLEFHIGLPDTFSRDRIAAIQPVPLWAMPFRLGRYPKIPARMVFAMLNPRSLTARAFGNPRMRNAADFNSRPDLLAVEIPAANGMGDARSIARLYSEFATGSPTLGVAKETIDALAADPRLPSGGIHDRVLRTDTVFSLGFMKPHSRFDFASSGRAFGTPGAGGSFGFADPDARLGMAYVMNRMGVHLVDDPREKSLRDAVYRSVAKFGPGQ